jgi:hypothetical protein
MQCSVFFIESQIVSSTTLVGLLKAWKREEMSPRWQEGSVTENMRVNIRVQLCSCPRTNTRRARRNVERMAATTWPEESEFVRNAIV